MKTQFVCDIQERDLIDTLFLVRQKITALAKNGKPYLTLKLMDRTGEIEARVWERVEELSDRIQKDDFLHIRGKANVYLGKMQLVVQEADQVPEGEVSLEDFLPVCGRSQEEMLAELQQQVASIADPYLKSLMGKFLEDAAFMTAYRQAPAAKTMHHVYLGGLLEHSLAIAGLVDDVSRRYPGLNRDLLLVGALLHDIGKTRELDYARSFDYTDEGKLLGHIVIGAQMVQDKIRQVEGFPPKLETLLVHLMLSHHGQYDYGSPKRPKTLEAVILNFLDDLDSKINGVRTHLDRETEMEGDWSSYHRLYDRYFYKGDSAGQSIVEKQTPVETASKPVDKPAPAPQKAGGKKKRADKPLGFTLAEQLQGVNTDLFNTTEKDKE